MPFENFFKRGKTQSPSLPQTTEPKVLSPWQAQNQETLDELARFIDFAEGFTLGFLEINFEDDLDEVLKVLRTRRECHGIQFHVFNFNDPDLRFLKDELEQAIQPFQQSTSLLLEDEHVMFVKGLENAIGLFGDYPPVLQDLNFVRDAWIESVPYPVLFCLPSYAINRIIQFAPDFWSWKSGVFRILSSQEREDEASIYALHAQKAIGNASELERRERIKLLEKLSQEFDPLQANRSKADLRIATQALTELGIVYSFAGELLKAQAALELSVAIFTNDEWQPETQRDLVFRIRCLTWLGLTEQQLGQVAPAENRLREALTLNTDIDAGLKSLTYYCLGQLKAEQGEVSAAIDLYQQSLDTYERTGYVQGKAAVFHSLGILKARQGEVSAAIDLYQQSLDIKERIGDVQGKAAVFHSLGILKARQGEVSAAIDLYQQSLDIKERIGNVQGKAATFHSLGKLKVRQGEVSAAIDLYQQSLEIYERIGNVQGKAATFHSLGKLKAEQEEVSTAIDLYQQSLEIYERIGNVQGKAATLRELASVKITQGKKDEALALYQEALDIFECVGSALSKAKTLWKYGEALTLTGDNRTRRLSA